MKTREAIQLEYENQRVAISNQYYAQVEAARAARDAALAELDDPMLRLIAAGKEHMNCRECGPLCISCQKALRDAIDYAEQRRAPGVKKIARGDTVKHQPTGETWLVMQVSDGYLYPAGWPKSRALVADCVLVKKGDAATLEWLNKGAGNEGG